MSASTSTGDEPDPFAGVVDEAPFSAGESIAQSLTDAKRGWFPLRKVFVQRPRGSGPQPNRPSPRASLLYDFVNGRQQRALDFYLLLHAYQPVLHGSPLKLSAWARMLSERKPCSVTAVTRTIETLEAMNLLERMDKSHSPVLRLKKEDGSGEAYVRPGSLGSAEGGPGYCVVPYQFWTSGLYLKLTLPGQAMFLITLAETQSPKTPSFAMAYERARDWYGLSERTAERGFAELREEGVLKAHVQKVADRTHPAGRREVVWRALAAPYSTASRQHAQNVATDAVRGTSSSLLAVMTP